MIDVSGKKVDARVIEGLEIPGEQRVVRARLALEQQRAQRAEIAQAQFGFGFTARAIHDRIRRVAPFRLFRFRTTRWFAVEGHATLSEDLRRELSMLAPFPVSSLADTYPRLIPDAALLKYQEAKEGGLFQQFFVVEAGYEKRRQPAPDPWLVGQTDNRYIVLAYWD